jgi:tetratricopeptide (TPR) repeat protein
MSSPGAARKGRPNRRQQFEFRHLLTRDAAYEALLDNNRRALHAAAAEVLATRIQPGAPDELPRLPSLQRHYELAGLWREAHDTACRNLLRRSHLGRHDGWVELAEHAQELWELVRASDPQLPAWSAAYANAYSLYAGHIGQIEQASLWAGRALELAEADGNQEHYAAALIHNGMASHFAGKHDEAIAYYQRALELQRELGNSVGEIQALNNLGLILHEGGASAEGRPWLEEGLRCARLAGNQLMEANLALNLGIALIGLGETEEAKQHIERAHELSLQLGDVSTESFAHGYLGNLASDAGDVAAALQHYQRAIQMTELIQSPRIQAYWLTELAALEAKRGELLAYERAAVASLRYARQSGDRYMLLQCLCLAACAVHTEAEARTYFQEAGRLADELGLVERLATTAEYVQAKQRLAATPAAA